MTPQKNNRRSFLKTTSVLAGGASMLSNSRLSAQPDKVTGPLMAYVGTYTSPLQNMRDTQVDLPPGNGRGIHMYHVDRDTGFMTAAGLHEMGTSPSALAFSEAGTRLYSANETERIGDEEHGSISAFAVSPVDGTLTLMNSVSSGGKGPGSSQCASVGTFCACCELLRWLCGSSPDSFGWSSGQTDGPQERCRKRRTHKGDQCSPRQLRFQRSRPDSCSHDRV